MLVSAKPILERSQEERYAVGAFNINNLEILQAVVRAAEAKRSPVLLQTSEGALRYAGLVYLYRMAETAAAQTPVPIALHLDHGRDLKTVRKCLEIGYTSVMIDGSHLPYGENVRLTSRVVSWARKKGVSVEGELGVLGGVGEEGVGEEVEYTDPAQARDFVERTGVDFLAVAIGTSHGAYKFRGEAEIDLPRLREIQREVSVPLVLHGASSVPSEILERARRFGARIEGARGVPEEAIREAIRNGVCKINIDTDLRLAMTAAIRQVLAERPEVFDPREILGPARDLMEAVAREKMDLFGSTGRA
jgi:fructose-bisphosphate aldolase class II